MAAKLKAKAKVKKVKAASGLGPTIPECPAFRKCREKMVDCSTCLSLSEKEWREHVHGVLGH